MGRRFGRDAHLGLSHTIIMEFTPNIGSINRPLFGTIVSSRVKSCGEESACLRFLRKACDPEEHDSNLFVTGFYLVADAARSQMLYANAGCHPEPLQLHRLLALADTPRVF
jgi:hypothetical protein